MKKSIYTLVVTLLLLSSTANANYEKTKMIQGLSKNASILKFKGWEFGEDEAWKAITDDEGLLIVAGKEKASYTSILTTENPEEVLAGCLTLAYIAISPNEDQQKDIQRLFVKSVTDKKQNSVMFNNIKFEVTPLVIPNSGAIMICSVGTGQN